jgi:hypothetical protein
MMETDGANARKHLIVLSPNWNMIRKHVVPLDTNVARLNAKAQLKAR